jgi:hypothetical protein
MSESPPIPIRPIMAIGSNVIVIITTLIIIGTLNHISCGYPKIIKSMPVSIVFLGSSIPPKNFPESV